MLILSLTHLKCAVTDNGIADAFPPGGKRIFIGTAGNWFTGVAGADAQCSSDALKPSTSTYKAILVDGVVRRACSTSNCAGSNEGVDWVLFPNTPYYRSTSPTKIFTTNSKGIFIFGQFESAISDTILNTPIYTGLNVDWTTSAHTCTNWTAEGSAGGAFGDPRVLNSAALASGSTYCNKGYPLLCVEQ